MAPATPDLQLRASSSGLSQGTAAASGSTGLSQAMAATSIATPRSTAPPPPGLPTPNSIDQRLIELFEEHILLHSDNVMAVTATSKKLKHWEPAGMFHSEDSVHAALAMMGYSVTARLPWERLGLCWEEGPVPDEVLVEQQARLAEQLLRAVARHAGNADTAALCNGLADQMQADGRQCLELLPTIRKARRKRHKDIMPRYREVELPFLRYLNTVFSKRGEDMILSQLSNLQGLILDGKAHPPLAARLLHEQAGKEAKAATAAFLATSCSRWLCWAPEDSASAGRWWATLKQVFAAKPEAAFSMLVSRPIFPGQVSPKTVLDYWSPPLLRGDGRRHVSKLEFLEPPVRVLSDGPHGPRVSEQHLAMITFGSASGDLPTPVTTCWLDGPANGNGQEAIVVDYPRDVEEVVLSVLEKAQYQNVKTWSRPMASPSCRGGRRVIYGYTGMPMDITALEATLLVRSVKASVAMLPGLVVGHTSIMEDPGALVVDFTEPDALAAQPAFFDQVLLLAPRRGVLITTTPRDVWERMLTSQAESPEQPQVLRLAWRASTRGGRPWVMPQVLSVAQAACMKGDWAAAAGPARCTIHVQVQGDTSKDPAHILNVLVDKLIQRTGDAWTAAAHGSVPKPYQIAPVAGPAGEWDGGFVMEAADPATSQSVASLMNGICFSGAAGIHRLKVGAQHDYQQKVANHPSGNGSRRR